MANTSTDPHDELPPAMDYKMHEATYQGFMAFTKYSIIVLAFVVLALYCFIEAQQALLGVVLLLAGPVVVLAMVVMGRQQG